MIEIISNGSKWYNEKKDDIKELKKILKTYALDPTFEKYGNFYSKPKFLKEELNIKYKNCTKFFGNFKTCSHVFNIITDDEKLINELKTLIDENKKRNDYIKYKKELNLFRKR